MEKACIIVLLIGFVSVVQAMPPVPGMEEALWQEVLKEKMRLGIDNITDPVRDAGKEGMFNTAFSTPQKLVSGTKHIAAVCINFPDYSSAYDTSDFHSMFFGSWASGSVRDYYAEVSYSTLDLHGAVDGWYLADNDHDYYGYANGWVRAARLAKEAAEKADGNVDYSLFDNNGDGYVDVFTVVHSGYGREETGDGGDIWSHAWSFYSAGIGVYVSDDPDPNEPGEYIKVNRYTIQPELSNYSNNDTMVCIGVFCHEWGHAFGLPDLYDTDGGDGNAGVGIGNWCLMATGSWGGNGQTPWAPAHLSAWAKTDLGWLAPITVNFNTMYDIHQVETNAQCFLLRTASEPREYFLVENRQQVSFDSTIHNAGLCIYHIDEEIINLRRYYNQVNAGGSYPYGVALEQADGVDDLWYGNNRGDSGDVYPGSTNNTAFDSAGTVPDSRTNDGNDSWCGINEITSSASTMQAFMYVSNQDTLIGVGDGPFHVEVLPNSEYAYIPCLLSSEVVMMDTRTFATVNIPYIFSFPLSIGSLPNSEQVYITNLLTDNVTIWDVQEQTSMGTIIVGDGPNYALAHPSGDYVYVTNEYSDDISVIRTSDNTVIDTIPVGDGPCCADTLPGADLLYVTHMYDNTVLVIRMSDNTVVDTIPVGNHPLGIAALPSADYVYVTNHDDDNVSVIRTSDNTIVEIVPVGDGPNKIVSHPSGEYLYVTNDISDNVSVIRTSDNTVIEEIPVGDNPIGIDILPGGNLLYVANYDDDNVQVIRTPSILPPAAPRVMCEKSSTHIVLRWERVTDIWGNTEDVRHYNIYRDVSPNFVVSSLNLLAHVYPPETTYVDSYALDVPGNLYYLVTAIDSMDQVSDKSNMSYKFNILLNENPAATDENVMKQ